MPSETLAPVLETLLTGHFFEGAGYQTWRAQGTRDDLLIYTLSGGGRFGYAGGAHRSSPGELVLLRSGTPHDYATEKTVGHWELLWAHFRPRAHWNAWLGWPQLAPVCCTFNSSLPSKSRSKQPCSRCTTKPSAARSTANSGP